MTSIGSLSDAELNSGSLSSDQPRITNPSSQSSGKTTETDESTGLTTGSQDDYPEQLHAGAVGYGPSYKKGVVSIVIP